MWYTSVPVYVLFHGRVGHQRTSKQILGNNQESSIFALASHTSLLLSIFHHLEVMENDGHVERMDNERLLKKVMNAKVDGRSALGGGLGLGGWME